MMKRNPRLKTKKRLTIDEIQQLLEDSEDDFSPDETDNDPNYSASSEESDEEDVVEEEVEEQEVQNKPMDEDQGTTSASETWHEVTGAYRKTFQFASEGKWNLPGVNSVTEVFQQFVDDEMLESIVHQTNKIAQKKNLKKPWRDLDLDESVVPFRGRLKFRQYLPGKAHKYGVKLYKVCDTDGYTYKVIVYAGKEEKNESAVVSIRHVVLELLSNYLDEGRTLVAGLLTGSKNVREAIMEYKDTAPITPSHNALLVVAEMLIQSERHREMCVILGVGARAHNESVNAQGLADVLYRGICKEQAPGYSEHVSFRPDQRGARRENACSAVDGSPKE